jgi:hypothetical protein
MNRKEQTEWDTLQDRLAAGEPLTVQEVESRRACLRADPLARRESEILAMLGRSLDRSDVDAQDVALIQRVLRTAGAGAKTNLVVMTPKTVATERKRRLAQRQPAWLLFGAGVATAAAATIAVFVLREGKARRTSIEAMPIKTVTDVGSIPESGATLALLRRIEGEVRIDRSRGGEPEKAVADGEPLIAGDRIRTTTGRACLRIEPAIDVCLDRASEAEVASTGSAEPQIVVRRGIVVAALAPRAAGQSFSLRGGGVVAVAHGTVFGLDRSSPDWVDVVVLEGAVAVREEQRDAPPRMVTAHRRWRVSLAAAGVEVALSSNEEDRFSEVSPRRPAPRVASRTVPEQALDESVAETPSTLLERARAALDRDDPHNALASYQRLRERFPRSPEAITILVTMGRIELERANAPRRALADFRSYLRLGDKTLDTEALSGEVRALRAMGRIDEEGRAIDEYLARFPTGFEAPALRARLKELQPGVPNDASDMRP